MSTSSQLRIKTILDNNKKEFDQNNVEQLEAVDLIASGQHVLISGEGGTGKSHFISTLSKIFFENKVNYRIVTPTGITAINLNESLMSNGCTPCASTYHSLYGFIPNRSDRSLSAKIKKTISEIEVLIIDEAPMIDSFSLDRISFRHTYPNKDTSELKSRLKNGMFGKSDMFTKFFGKTQVIMLGDFFQLPPIVKDDLTKYGYKSKYIFDSNSYELGEVKMISFYKNYRVTTFKDEKNILKSKILKQLLKEVRYGCLSDDGKRTLKLLNVNRVIEADKIIKKLLSTDAILLSPYNQECYRINDDVKSKLPGYDIRLPPHTSPNIDKELSACQTKDEEDRFLKKRFDTPRVLKVKIGQRVLLTSNNKTKGFFNGDMGIVKSTRTFQGAVDSIVINVDRRGESIEYIVSRQLYIKPTATELINLNISMANNTTRFASQAQIDAFTKKHVKNWIEQFPLKDGFAITNHRAQGKTFQNTIINPDGFGESMFYVSLSRNTNLDGILLTQQIRRSHIQVDPYVLKFYLDEGLIEEYMEDAVRKKLGLDNEVEEVVEVGDNQIPNTSSDTVQ